MFDKVLIANRGEIAVRVIDTCREMGIATVAVYSEVDRLALHVLWADEAVCLGDSEPSQSYLNADRIVAAAVASGAGAIHPGYGFLSENADFARKCADNGIEFIGPPPEVIQNFGNKMVARQMMIDGGVPVVPGMTSPETDPGVVAAQADEIGYPVLVKAAAGGGGKGMRLVENAAELAAAMTASSSEAAASFGDGSVYLEKFIVKPRHVEIQILADKHGRMVHLLERECSIQRRHQKIIEETPSVALTPELRREMGETALRAAAAAGYVNAGTVEFILDEENGRFYFLETNTRLQVEHPITEMITGLDIVRRQIEIAAGLPLDLEQENITARGHAIECRIYAEDPASGFFPSPGTIGWLREPVGPGIRNDCGVYSGFVVPMEYDPILSKLVVHAENRDSAIARMKKALGDYMVAGVKTPIPFLSEVIDSEPFRRGETFTDFIETHFPDWQPSFQDRELAALAFIADAILPDEGRADADAVPSTGLPTPWQTLGGWRL
ncbi:MAG: acetyl/propionyl/methylcrotonyl-CoA carboxylase subunit alpha [Desulfosudaceae bacterium]